MRLHLIIQRHELPAIRILWTVPRRSPGLSHQPSVASSFTVGVNPAASSSRGLSTNTSFNTALTSLSSTDSAYTFAQLLGDVNEVVPLETSPDHVEYQEGGGQWALEDYVVELMGSECLHFMEVDKLLRDGDELV